MLTALRNWWRGLWAEPVAATAVVEAKPESIPWGKIFALLGESTADPRIVEIKRGDFKPPTVLKGVRPETPPTGDALVLAMDEGYKEPEHMAYDDASFGAAWGFNGTGNLGPGLAFLGFPFLAELVQITEYRTPSESLSTEMTRRWLKLKNKGDGNKADKIKQIEDRLEELKVRDHFREAALKTEQFGRSHIMVNVKNQGDDKTRQLPLTEIKKGELLGFATIEPYWLTPYSWNATRPEQPDFYRPQSWYVLGRKTHQSRLLTFIFREVPDLLKPAYDFAGISMTQLMMPYVNRWLRTAKSVNDLINIFSIVTLATDLQALLQKPEDFEKRLRVFTAMRDNKGMMTVNKDTEELSMQNVPLSSLDKLQAQAQEHMATPGRMPLIKFFGIVPTGLNSDGGETEMLVWYDYVHAIQELGYSPHFEVVLKFVQQDLFGAVDPDITFEWQPLYEPNDKEKSEMRKGDTERDGMLVEKGIVTPDEVRERLKHDPESGYNNLKGNAPEPTDYAEAQIGEASAEADHERGEESAEQAHKRAKEMQAAEEAATDATIARDEAFRVRDQLRAENRALVRAAAAKRGARSPI